MRSLLPRFCSGLRNQCNLRVAAYLRLLGPKVVPARPLSQSGNSASFRLVVCLMSVFEAVNRPEVRVLGLLFPWIFIVSLLGFLGAWLVLAIMEYAGLSRHVWHLPLFFVALVVLFSSLIGFICLP